MPGGEERAPAHLGVLSPCFACREPVHGVLENLTLQAAVQSTYAPFCMRVHTLSRLNLHTHTHTHTHPPAQAARGCSVGAGRARACACCRWGGAARGGAAAENGGATVRVHHDAAEKGGAGVRAGAESTGGCRGVRPRRWGQGGGGACAAGLCEQPWAWSAELHRHKLGLRGAHKPEKGGVNAAASSFLPQLPQPHPVPLHPPHPLFPPRSRLGQSW